MGNGSGEAAPEPPADEPVQPRRVPVGELLGQ